jgi:hypothetical protein
MNSSAFDIRDLLVTALGLVKGTTIFLGVEPANPDNTVTVFDTPGLPPDLTLDRDEKYGRPSIQVRVRNNNYQTGWALANNIKDALHGRANETLGGTYYSLISATDEPAMLDYDRNGRPRFIINFNLQRYPVR